MVIHATPIRWIELDHAIVVRDVTGLAQAREATLTRIQASDPPTALFTAQNLITVGAIRALRDLGRHRRTAVVGFDDFLLADLLDPPVTVVAQDPSGVGIRAARCLFARIDGDLRPPRRELVRTRLIVRGSGELAP